jgi:hypothetical protein
MKSWLRKLIKKLLRFLGLISAPTTQATDVAATSITDTTIIDGVTRGNGTNILVLAKQGSAVNSTPINGNRYTANAEFGSGSQIGIGNYVVYIGAANSYAMTGLSADTTYHRQVFEFSGLKYNTSTASGNPASAATTFITEYQDIIDYANT